LRQADAFLDVAGTQPDTLANGTRALLFEGAQDTPARWVGNSAKHSIEVLYARHSGKGVSDKD
jgi:hypothetical protein